MCRGQGPDHALVWALERLLQAAPAGTRRRQYVPHKPIEFLRHAAPLPAHARLRSHLTCPFAHFTTNLQGGKKRALVPRPRPIRLSHATRHAWIALLPYFHVIFAPMHEATLFAIVSAALIPPCSAGEPWDGCRDVSRPVPPMCDPTPCMLMPLKGGKGSFCGRCLTDMSCFIGFSQSGQSHIMTHMTVKSCSPLTFSRKGAVPCLQRL